jgi:hypothetical protein
LNRNRSLSLSMCSVWRRWTVVWLFFWPPWRWHQGPKEESGWHLRDNKQGNAKPRVNAIFYVPGRVGTGTKEAYYGGDPSRASMVGRVVLVPGTTGTSTSTSTGTGSTTGIPGPCGTGSDSGMGNFFLETETGNSHANAGATSPRLQNRTASTGNESATTGRYQLHGLDCVENSESREKSKTRGQRPKIVDPVTMDHRTHARMALFRCTGYPCSTLQMFDYGQTTHWPHSLMDFLSDSQEGFWEIPFRSYRSWCLGGIARLFLELCYGKVNRVCLGGLGKP